MESKLTEQFMPGFASPEGFQWNCVPYGVGRLNFSVRLPCRLFLLWLLALSCGAAAAAECCDDVCEFGDTFPPSSSNDVPKPAGWSLLEYDFDDRGFNVLHFQGSTDLPRGFSIWGFIDLEGDPTIGSNREDLSRFFLEIDLKKKLWQTGGLVVEYNDLQGDDNAIGRFGVYYAPKLEFLSPTTGIWSGPGRIAFKVFPLETDGRGGQFSFNWHKRLDNVADGRISAGGFFDLNYDAGPRGVILVTEHQLRLRLTEGLHAIVEFRVNEFLNDDYGIAPGIQYRF